jgi:hypothetical protein
MTDDGRCPSCGEAAEHYTLSGRRMGSDVNVRELAGDEKAPWHFKLLVVLLVLYLGWRVVDIFV